MTDVKVKTFENLWTLLNLKCVCTNVTYSCSDENFTPGFIWTSNFYSQLLCTGRINVDPCTSTHVRLSVRPEFVLSLVCLKRMCYNLYTNLNTPNADQLELGLRHIHLFWIIIIEKKKKKGYGVSIHVSKSVHSQ